MTINHENLKELHGYLEGSANAVDEASSSRAIAYKNDVCKNFINLSHDQIDLRLGGTIYYVTRKYDGEMNVLFYNGEDAVIINRSGRVRKGLPCVEDAKETLKKAGITQAIIPAELYVDEPIGRTRVFDVLEALANNKKTATLRLAVFDLLELNEEPLRANSYEETYEKITELFADSKLCHPVRYKKVTSKSEVKELFEQWVEQENSEGLVVRTELPLVYKIKPRYTIDVAVVGYSEGTAESKGQVRSLLLAMMPEEGQYQIIGKTGNGFSEDFKKELLEKLEPLIMDSQYIETDSNHVAFHMIKPEHVIELMINDVLFETSSGLLMNPLLEIVDGAYVHRGNIPGLSVVFPIFVRFRDDKKAVYQDIRLEQINEFSYVETKASVEEAKQEKSQLLKRIVYKKESGTKLMVQKFMVWKTNKEAAGFPAYVFHYTNFSSDRKENLQRDVTISSSEQQIMELLDASLSENVKKGWVLCD